MLRNYLITAWKVFLRRKFFTFINLFGICITLTVIVVTARVVDNHLNPTGPEKNNEHYLVISNLIVTNDNETNVNSSQLGYKFINDYVRSLKAPEKISAFTKAEKVTTHIRNRKVEPNFRRTDANYWEILQFEFVEGKAFDQQAFEMGNTVAVINQHTAKQYFGKSSAVGEYIKIRNQQFKVIGVVKNVPRTELDAFSDIWVPFTTFPTTAYRHEIMGNFKAILYHSNREQLKDARLEFINRLQHDFQPVNGSYTKAFSHADSPLQAMARDLFGEETGFEDHIPKLLILASLLSFLFMLLPSINMVNLNISRIMERASEIGVRKAFGASTAQLVWQFIIENILLTLIGGTLAFLFSMFILNGIEVSGLIAYVEFPFNFRIFAISIFMMLVFAIVSGVYPAFKMARLHPVIALKGGI